MNLRRTLTVFALALVPLFGGFTQGCVVADDSASQSDDVTQMSGYELNFARMNEIYPDAVPIATPADAWTALVTVGEQTIPAPTHLFGDVINIIPYSNDDNVTDASGAEFKYGDQEVAKVFKPGQLGIGLKMHRPEKRSLDLNNSDAAAMKEDFKLQDTHIEIVVGVEKAEHGAPGAITLNNPQTYENGRFGNETYSMIFFRPEVPEYAAQYADAYESNSRLALVGFNAVTEFPGDYNGGDPLGARDPDKLREYVDQMVRAIGGDTAAQDWFKTTENMVYCAELAFIALSAGVIQPINATTMVPRVGQDVWDAFVAQVNLHNQGVDEFQETGNVTTPSNFLALNGNKRVGMVRIELAPEDLRPIAELSPDPAGAAQQLALTPMTMSDIVEQFMRTHLPRQILGEAMAPVQGAVLAKMKPGLLETMGMNEMPETDPRRVAVEQLFEQLVQVVSTPFENYDAFRAAIEPLLAAAREITGPRDGSGNGLFVPPSLFHVAAQGQHPGLIKLQYEGHGVHVSATQKSATPEPEPTPVDDIVSEVSCASPTTAGGEGNSCGNQAPGGCWCDGECLEYGDCCDDYQPVCGG
ncbi:MAG: hypothetical protein JRI68_28600 [Deltaproteobacteria bacterium]|nr:hypothetical protein [Deltaproteobacteria bacterium]